MNNTARLKGVWRAAATSSAAASVSTTSTMFEIMPTRSLSVSERLGCQPQPVLDSCPAVSQGPTAEKKRVPPPVGNHCHAIAAEKHRNVFASTASINPNVGPAPDASRNSMPCPALLCLAQACLPYPQAGAGKAGRGKTGAGCFALGCRSKQLCHRCEGALYDRPQQKLACSRHHPTPPPSLGSLGCCTDHGNSLHMQLLCHRCEVALCGARQQQSVCTCQQASCTDHHRSSR